jgi:hypothetical protein
MYPSQAKKGSRRNKTLSESFTDFQRGSELGVFEKVELQTRKARVLGIAPPFVLQSPISDRRTVP